MLVPLGGRWRSLLGVWPALLLNWVDPSVGGWVENLAALKP